MMNIITWIEQQLLYLPAIKAVAVICLLCAVGLTLGKVSIRGFRLGATFVFFAGILAGALGIEIDHDMLLYAQNFGLIMFVYVLGLQVGPGFVSSFRNGGAKLPLLSLGVIAFGTLLSLMPFWAGSSPLGEMVGVLCGATTNTPALAAGQQGFADLGHPDEGISAALSLAVTYPIGVVGVILALFLLRKFCREDHAVEKADSDEAFIASFEVSNPAIFGKNLHDASDLDEKAFVVSRVWRDGHVILPNAETILQKGDRIMAITRQRYVKSLTVLFGKLDDTDWMRQDIDWNALDSNLVSERVVVTKPSINGKHLGSLNLRNRFGVNVSRVKRGDLQLVATPDLILRIGDRLNIVGEAESCRHAARALGNSVQSLEEPNMFTIFVGVVMGLLLGYIPIALPGISTPLRLGMAGGPIVMGILIGAYGPRLHMVTYVTTSANRLIRSLGLSTYLACLGLDAGPQFLETVMRPAALAWIGWAVVIAIVPVVIFGIIAMRTSRLSYASAAGMLCGVMANPIALEYVNDSEPGDKANVSYAAVYPLAMFVRVLIAQIIVMTFFQ